MGENAGFARAVNRGWQRGKRGLGRHPEQRCGTGPAWMERLPAGRGNASFATGTDSDAADRNRVDGTYDLMSRAACAWRAGHGEPAGAAERPPPPSPSRPAPHASSGAKCSSSLNGFDERFGSYLEDVDLGLRCLEGASRAYTFRRPSPGIMAARRWGAGMRAWCA